MKKRLINWAFGGSTLRAGVAGAFLAFLFVGAVYLVLYLLGTLVGHDLAQVIYLVGFLLWLGFILGKSEARSRAATSQLDRVLAREDKALVEARQRLDDLNERLNAHRDRLSDL